nr:MAG TPA: Glutaminase [Caudoviricetes sp.]
MEGIIACSMIVVGMAIITNSKKAMAFCEKLANKLGW